MVYRLLIIVAGSSTTKGTRGLEGAVERYVQDALCDLTAITYTAQTSTRNGSTSTSTPSSRNGTNLHHLSTHPRVTAPLLVHRHPTTTATREAPDPKRAALAQTTLTARPIPLKAVKTTSATTRLTRGNCNRRRTPAPAQDRAVVVLQTAITRAEQARHPSTVNRSHRRPTASSSSCPRVTRLPVLARAVSSAN